MYTQNNRPAMSINEQQREVQRLVNGFFRAHKITQLHEYISTLKAAFLKQSIDEGIYSSDEIIAHTLALDYMFNAMLKIENTLNTPLILKS